MKTQKRLLILFVANIFLLAVIVAIIAFSTSPAGMIQADQGQFAVQSTGVPLPSPADEITTAEPFPTPPDESIWLTPPPTVPSPPSDEEIYSRALTPDPTTPPLPEPLTREEALAKAIELDNYMAVRDAPLPDTRENLAIVNLYQSRQAADKALGSETWYDPAIETDAGQVWLIVIPGPVRLVLMPGTSEETVFEAVGYQFSARTGEFLGVSGRLTFNGEVSP